MTVGYYIVIVVSKIINKYYNRYGNYIYHTEDYKNDWNGRYMNKTLPDGTYYFVLNAFAYNDKQQLIRKCYDFAIII